MSKILANEIANYGDNAPIELKEGLNVPVGKPLQIGGVSGSNGQVLTTTGNTVVWTTPFSGNYNSLTNLPTIPAAQVNSDWNAVGTVAEILNKPIIPPQSSVTLTAPGSSTLTFNGVNGEFTFTPPDLSSYLTTYTESDPIFLASPAYQITNQNRTEWGLAYSWGDHASAGYLTSYTETDPVFTASVAFGITLQNKTNWDTAYGWGNHAAQGYITSYTETDPVFLASAAAGVTTQLVSNWNTAYTWGDHGQSGYLTDLSSSSIDGLSDVSLSGAVSGQLLQYNGSNWVNFTPSYLTTLGSIGGHTDVDVTTPGVGQILQYNGSQWENATATFLTSYTETDTLASVTARGASTNTACTFLNVTISGNLNVLGTTTQNNVTTLNVTNNEIVINENQASGGLNAIIRNDRGSDSDVDIRWDEVADRWKFTNDGSTYYNFPTSASDLTNDAGYLTSTGSIGSHTDVTVATPVDNQLLKYNDGSSRWENWTPNYLTTVGGINSFTDVTISAPSVNEVLRYNGSEWVNAPVSTTAQVVVQDAAPSNPQPGDMWWKSNEGTLKIYYADSDTSQWVDASPIGDPFENVYASVAFFPGANVNEGGFAYSQATGAMYYSNAVSWTSQRVVTTNNSTTSDFSALLANTQLTYSIDTFDDPGANPDKKIVRLSDSQGVTSDIILTAGTGLSVIKSNNEITFNNDVIDTTYGISVEAAAGANSTLRLTDSQGVLDDVVFAGADGLTVENTDANTITFRAPDISSQFYTDEKAQDAVATMFANGTHTNITFTYDDTNNSLSATAQAGGGGGGTTYDLLGSNTTSNNAILTLRDANNNDDDIEITGGGGTTVTWDGANNRIALNSTAPVQSDWDATAGLAQILNKPSIPSAYTLPIASPTILGGFKVGANLSIDVDGVLSSNPGSYTLPTADATTLGGIKVGSGLSIDGNGVLTATGGSSVPSIQDLSGTTASLAADQSTELNITGYKAYSLFKITTDAEAWVRVYVDDASRDVDTTRSEGEDPSPGGGVIAEVRTSGAESILITPGIMGFNNDSPRTDTIYLAVTNRSGSATTITVTLTALQIGE
jgi:hypothetical protein